MLKICGIPFVNRYITIYLYIYTFSLSLVEKKENIMSVKNDAIPNRESYVLNR